MASRAQKRTLKRLPARRDHTVAFRRLFLTYVFPDEGSYPDSRWASWEKRIKQGHDAEEKLIEQIYNKHKDQPGCDPSYDPAEWAGEDCLETWHLTNSMYAALAVSIWSEMEHFLKGVLSLCYQVLEKKKRALEETQKFCEDSLAGKLSRPAQKAKLESCIKALKDTQIPYAFDDIRIAIKKAVGVKVHQCTGYMTVDAIRVLNNSFKHNRGCYQPEHGKPYTQIDEALLKKWCIPDERDEIDYSKLPVKELVIACNSFCADLLHRVETQLGAKLGGAK